MKTKITLLLLSCFLFPFFLSSQPDFRPKKPQSFQGISLGLSSGISIVSDNSGSFNNGISGGYVFPSGLGLSAAFEMAYINNLDTREAKVLPGLTLGVSKMFDSGQSTPYINMEVYSNVHNAFRGFGNFENCYVDVGCRLYFFKIIYLGASLRYTHQSNLSIFPTPQHGVGLYTGIGLQYVFPINRE